MKKQYEDTTAVEKLEQQTAKSLSQGWTLWNSTDPIIVGAILAFCAGITGSATAWINFLGNPILLIMVFVLAQIMAIAWVCWQYQERFHRISFVCALWIGFSFALDLGMVMS